MRRPKWVALTVGGITDMRQMPPNTYPQRDRVKELAGLVSDMGTLFREHVAQLNEKIDTLQNRIVDLEGHAEHGPDGECGVCCPETVSAVVYGEVLDEDEGDSNA